MNSPQRWAVCGLVSSSSGVASNCREITGGIKNALMNVYVQNLTAETFSTRPQKVSRHVCGNETQDFQAEACLFRSGTD